MASAQPSPTEDPAGFSDGGEEDITTRGEGSVKRKRTFHPFRAVRNIFRRANKRQGEDPTAASKKSRSTSELSTVEDNQDQEPSRLLAVPSFPSGGLSVSHESIFASEAQHQGEQSQDLSTQRLKGFKDELKSRVQARRDSDSDDAGLPRSPCTSPTTADVLSRGLLQDKPCHSRSTCSAGSLISMGSSENDEDIMLFFGSGPSSRMPHMERRPFDLDGMAVGDGDPATAPLNHQAAHHKISIRPKRTHGLPRHRKLQMAAATGVGTLPSTPELMEDMTLAFKEMNEEFSKTTESSDEIEPEEPVTLEIAAKPEVLTSSTEETTEIEKAEVHKATEQINTKDFGSCSVDLLGISDELDLEHFTLTDILLPSSPSFLTEPINSRMEQTIQMPESETSKDGKKIPPQDPKEMETQVQASSPSPEIWLNKQDGSGSFTENKLKLEDQTQVSKSVLPSGSQDKVPTSPLLEMHQLEIEKSKTPQDSLSSLTDDSKMELMSAISPDLSRDQEAIVRKEEPNDNLGFPIEKRPHSMEIVKPEMKESPLSEEKKKIKVKGSGKSNAAELKLRHEIKQYSKRQKEILDAEVIDAWDVPGGETVKVPAPSKEVRKVGEGFKSTVMVTSETTEVCFSDGVPQRPNRKSYDNQHKQEEEREEREVLQKPSEQSPKPQTEIPDYERTDNKAYKIITKTELKDKSRPEINDAEVNWKSNLELRKSEDTHIKVDEISRETPEKLIDRIRTADELEEEVVYRRRPGGSTAANRSSEDRSAFQSGDFADIMKKRRSMTEQQLEDSSSSEKVSVEILPFHSRSKEQSKMPHTVPDEEEKKPEVRRKLSLRAETPISSTTATPEQGPVGPVRFRIRRGKSLNEKCPVIEPEHPSPQDSRPKSQILSREAAATVPEFMKIQLRSSREELEEPQFEVKIGPSKVNKEEAKPIKDERIKESIENKENLSGNSPKEKVTNVPAKESNFSGISSKDVGSASRDRIVGSTPKDKLVDSATNKINENIAKDKLTSAKLGSNSPIDKFSANPFKDKFDDSSSKDRVTENSSKDKLCNTPPIEKFSSSTSKESAVENNALKDKLNGNVSKSENGDRRDEVLLRRKSFVAPQEEEVEPELLRVFARRSIKRNPKNKTEEPSSQQQEQPKTEENVAPARKEKIKNTEALVQEKQKKPIEKLKSVEPEKVEEAPRNAPLQHAGRYRSVSEAKVSTTTKSPETSIPSKNQAITTKIETKPSRTESKSLSINTTTSNIVSKSLKPEATVVNTPESVNKNHRQTRMGVRGKSEPFPPKKSEAVPRKSSDAGLSCEPLTGDSDIPSWKVMAQQRKEQREQKERMLYGSSANTFAIETGNNKPSRNSKVLDIVNNFQKLQTT